MSVARFTYAARAAVDRLREEALREGFRWSETEAVDVEFIARVVLGCCVVRIAGLTDRSAIRYLSEGSEIDCSGITDVSDEPLAGGLYVSADGRWRWIFLEDWDIPGRQRFSMAHEIGHLRQDILPPLATGPQLIPESGGAALLRHNRCAPEPFAVPPKRRWTDYDIREFRANHFAAELLMPLSGVRRLMVQFSSRRPIENAEDIDDFARHLAAVYKVSTPAARLRLSKDLRIRPPKDDANRDLFI